MDGGRFGTGLALLKKPVNELFCQLLADGGRTATFIGSLIVEAY